MLVGWSIVVTVLSPGVHVFDRIRVLDKLRVTIVIGLGPQEFNPDKRQTHYFTYNGQRAPVIDHCSTIELALHVRVQRYVPLLPQRSQRLL